MFAAAVRPLSGEAAFRKKRGGRGGVPRIPEPGDTPLVPPGAARSFAAEP